MVDLTNLQMNQTNDDRNDPTNDSIHGNQEYQQAIYSVVNDKFEFLVKAQLVSRLDNASKDTTGNVNQIDGSVTLIDTCDQHECNRNSMLSRHIEQCDAKIQVDTYSRDTNQNFAAKSYDKHSILSKPCFQDEEQSYDFHSNNPQIVHKTAPQLTSHILPQPQNDTAAASRCIVDTNLGIHNYNPYFTNLVLRTRDYRRTLFHRLLWNNSYLNDISSMTLLTSRLDPIGLQSLEAECQLRANRQLLNPRLVPLVTRDMTPQDSIDMSTTLGMEHFSITNGQIPVNANYCGPTSSRMGSFNRHCDSFPDILHRLLIDLECIPGGCDIAQFLPTGTGFILKDLQRFETDILKIYFPRMSRFGSFQRQLNLYDFQRIQSSTSRGVHYHAGFSRTLPLLCVRRKLKRTIKRK